MKLQFRLVCTRWKRIKLDLDGSVEIGFALCVRLVILAKLATANIDQIVPFIAPLLNT